MRITSPVLLFVFLFTLGCADTTETPTNLSGEERAQEDSTVIAYDLSRIVTLGGPVTEIVYAFGLGGNVVATDQSSVWPAEVHQKPRLGYFRQASAEGILSQNPTVIISLDGLGPDAVVEQIRATGVPIVVVPEVYTIEVAESRVELLGRELGRADSARAILARMRNEIARADSQKSAERPRALFIYARGAGLVNVSGTGTSADEVMRLAGAENAFSDVEDYQALTAEAVADASPDVIIIPERGLESIGGVEGLMRQPGIAQTPAGQQGNIITVDDALLLGLGPRVGQGVAELAEKLGDLNTEE